MAFDLTRREFLAASAAIPGAIRPDRSSSALSLLAPPARKPNVVMIVLDDLGSVDTHAYGSADLTTPNLDAIAASGVRFTQMCSAAPICGPSRAALMTGRCPQRAGVPGNPGSQPGARGIPADEVTIPQMLKPLGYATGHVGKWHLGYTKESMPNAKGFDSSFGHMGGCIDNYSHYFFWEGPNRHDLWENGKEVWREGENIGHLGVKQCCDFLEGHQHEPFFLYWAINMPHYPLQGFAKWRKHYENLPFPRSLYAASVSSLDELIGQVRSKLQELGLTDDTLIFVQSDHGHSTEERTFFGGGNAGPYRGAKFSLFEGGIRIVSVASYPNVIPAGQVRDQLVTGCDWLPTIAALTGATLPDRKLDGRSLIPILAAATAPTEHPTFNWQFQQQWASREGDWKLIGNPRDTSNKAPITRADQLFLSNLAQDVSEMTNFAAEHPDIVARLKAQHEAWVQDVHRAAV